jgi:C-5 cytosine-specific DNA methylase
VKPLAIDLFCGLGGWTEGLLAEGYDVVGFDIERHRYGVHRYPAQLVIQDVLTLHGSQFKDAAIIVASPPCQEYSYMAMPWKRAKAKAAAIRADATGAELERLNRLFNACLRIQFEASLAAGRHVPLVIENVKGAQPWVGRARWSFGSFYLWGDVPALMPMTFNGYKSSGMNWSDQTKRGQDVTRIAGQQAFDGRKGVGPKWDAEKGCGAYGMRRWTNPAEGIKCGGDWFNASQPSISRTTSSKSPARKFASAMIAKIPLPLSRHIAATYLPH